MGKVEEKGNPRILICAFQDHDSSPHGSCGLYMELHVPEPCPDPGRIAGYASTNRARPYAKLSHIQNKVYTKSAKSQTYKIAYFRN